MADSLTDIVKMEIYKQMRVCAELYKPIFASLADGFAPPVSMYCAEVLSYYELLAPHMSSEILKLDKYTYLDALKPLEPYFDDGTTIYREIYIKDGKRLNASNAQDKNVMGGRRSNILKRFRAAQKALDWFAFDFGLVDASGRPRAMGVSR